MNEDDIWTTLDLAHSWDVERNVAQRRAARWDQKLGITRVPARSPSGHMIYAYSKIDAERIIAAQRESSARRELNAIRKSQKAAEIKYEIGTADRSDVMTVHKLAKILNVSRARASKIAKRHEGKLGIQRVEARAASTHKTIAYKWSDGERLVDLFKEGRATKTANQKAKEERKFSRKKIPQPPAPLSRNQLFYLIELWPGVTDTYKIGWTSDIEQRQRTYRTTSPNLQLVKIWNCERDRDTEATRHALSFQGLEKTSSETFRTQNIDAFVSHLDRFFRTTTGKGS